MSHAQIIIPFGLPPAEHARDLVQTLTSRCPQRGLATLLSRHFNKSRQHIDDFSPALPHELWLRQHHRPSEFNYQWSRLNYPKQAEQGCWFIVNPVHLHIAQNHLVLSDHRQLALPESESRQLFDAALPLCQEAGVQLIYGDAHTWFLRADEWADFITSTPDAACGHNIEIWSVKGRKELAWRKLQNEIQMQWYIHPLKEQREARGDKAVNGLWIWGNSTMSSYTPATHENRKQAASSGSTAGTAGELINKPGILVLDQLSTAALAGDWANWLDMMTELENNWFVPLRSALKNRKLSLLSLHLSNSNTLLSTTIRPVSLCQFWRSPTLSHLA